MKIKEYVRTDGSVPFSKWFNRLDAQAAAKVAVALARLEQGNFSNIKWFKGLGEYRINWGPGYRVYLTQEGLELIILFGGGTKKNQQKDIEEALALLQEYKARRKGE
ncbi:MAG: type II toxin-antitoxin system RelE/ParE family toxin [Anaerolineaceae bacterium]|nr:type II toxin-antitoxin system RelE/ParE family toxin [Anaerolineaceae bacterium]